MSEVSADDRDLAIRTMLGEEGSDAGQAGVAAVILNRLAAGSYGGSVGDVVLAPKQFEAWTRQSDQLLGIRRDDPRYVAAGQLFDAVRDGSLPDPTNGATHFYAPAAQARLALVDGRPVTPNWAQGRGLKLGSSMFYAPQGRVERKPDEPGFKVDFSQIAKSPSKIADKSPSKIADKSPSQIGGDFPSDQLPPGATLFQPSGPKAASKAVEFPSDQLPPGATLFKPDAQKEAPGFVEKGLGEAGRALTEGPRNVKDMFLEGTAAGFGEGKQNVERGVAAMKSGPGGWLGGATSDVIGTVQEAAAPLTGGFMTLLGVLGSGDPAMVGAEAPHIASMGDAAKYARTGAEGHAAVEAPAPGAASPTLRPSAGEIPPAPSPSPRVGIEPREFPRDQLPPGAEPVKPSAEVRPGAPTLERLQGVVDHLKDRFSISVPVTVINERPAPGQAGKSRLERFVDTKEPIKGTIYIDPDMSPEHQLAVLTHEFGHTVQHSLFDRLPEVDKTAIFDAWKRDTKYAATDITPRRSEANREFVKNQRGAPVYDALDSDMRRVARKGTDRNAEASSVRYDATFDEWFANQTSKFLTTNREAVTSIDKFFKGIADLWKQLYEAFTGRKGSVPEVEAFLRKQGRFFEEDAKPTEPPAEVRPGAPTPSGEAPVAIQFRGKTYSGVTKLDAATAAQRATGISLDRIWDEATPEPGRQERTLPADIPTTVYRGSGRADPHSAYNQGMGPQSEPIAGPGRYYAFNKGDAQTFGPNVASAEMPVRNPLVIRDGNVWRELTRKAGWQTPNPFGTSEVQMREMTQRLQDVVRGMGHDGIVAYWDDASPYDIGPKGENLKLLRAAFGMPQVVKFEEEASRVPMTRGGESVPRNEEDEPIEEEPSPPIPRQPGDLGAAVSPPGPPLPDRPTREMVWEQEDRFNRLAKAPWADKSELLNSIDSWPARMKTAAAQERLYRHMEDPSFPLNAQERADYEQYIAPLKREERELWERAKKTDLEGIEDFDPTYAHRKRKGLSTEFDRPLGVGGGDEGPLGGQGRLPMSTSSMKDRVFYAIQDAATGGRKIVARDKDGNMRIIEPGKPAYPIGGAGIKIRDAFRDRNGRAWTLEQARTDEIEAATGLEYYKSAGANTIDNIVRLRQVVRAIHEVERLKGSPEWAAYAREVGERGTPRDWRVPKMPLFHGWRVEPRLADVIDDFYGHEPGSITENLAKINRWTVGTMFWSPVTHIANVGMHWFTARGWDNVTPHGMLSLAVDGARAFREVAGRGEKYQELLRDGNGLLYASTSLQKFSEMMLKRLGEDVARNPARWDPIARTLGVGPSDLVRMIYEGSSRILWSVSDMFMMQRVLELERKSMSTRDAIEEAERHIPNYRAHSEILGKRIAAQIYFHPLVTQFSRYHYGQLNSWANIAKDAVGGGKDALGRDRRFQALGNVMATGVMMVFVAPLVNEELKKAFGPKVRLPARGSTTLAGPIVDAAMQAQWAKKVFPKYVRDYYNDDSNLLMTAQNLFAIAPITRALGEFATNLDWFSGRRVAEPAEASDALHSAAKGQLKQAVGHAARVGLQEAEHAGERIVQPLSALSRIMQGDKGLVKGLIEQGLGLTEPNTAGIAAARRREESEANYRRRHPRGPLEELGGRLPF